MPIRKGSDWATEANPDRRTPVEANEPPYSRDWEDQDLEMDSLLAPAGFREPCKRVRGFSSGICRSATQNWERSTQMRLAVYRFLIQLYQASGEDLQLGRS